MCEKNFSIRSGNGWVNDFRVCTLAHLTIGYFQMEVLLMLDVSHLCKFTLEIT